MAKRSTRKAAQADWIVTNATVISCRYQFARMNTLLMGLQTGDKFRIGFEYYAHGRLYSGELQSPVAIAQNERVAIRYNPLEPQQNDHSGGATSVMGSRLVSAAVAGSIALALTWLVLAKGCN